MQVIKHPTLKVPKQILWETHQDIQKSFQPLNEWYKMNSDIIEDMDHDRQKIVRKYFRFQAGELMKDKKGEYILLHGMKIKDYDKEMEELMTGEVEIMDNGSIKWPVILPVNNPELKEQP